MSLPDAQALQTAAERVLSEGPAPTVGVVLGSGLGGFASRLERPRAIPYSAIPSMPQPSVSGHSGRLLLGDIGRTRVACLDGRVHAYEGGTSAEVCFGVGLLATLGCRTVLLSNAAGGIAPELTPGSLMLLQDHINLSGHNPLRGPNLGTGPRFPDMTTAYDPKLNQLALTAAEELGLTLHTGVYAGLLGPSYETPAEIRMLRSLGADTVGMSTVQEVIALRYYGIPTAAVSCVTNLAAGLGQGELNHEEVKETAARVAGQFEALFCRWIGKLP